MAALPLDTVVDAARARLASRCAGIVTPDLAFGKGAPISLDPKRDVDAYVLHLHPEDIQRATGTVYRRTHHIQVRLWVRTPDDASETLFLTLCDAIDAAFYQDQGMGIGMKSATVAAQRAAPYIQMGNVVRRQRVWELLAVEDFLASLAE
jgi:hypothetical protein